MISTNAQAWINEQIRELTGRAAHAVDLPAPPLYRSVWSDDAVIVHARPGGDDHLRPAQLWQRLFPDDGQRHAWQHHLRNQVITNTARKATAVTEIDVIGWRTGNKGSLTERRLGGWYRDELVQTAGGWRIRHRIVYIIRDTIMPTNLAEQPVTAGTLNEAAFLTIADIVIGS
jgi:hypothetical protein